MLLDWKRQVNQRYGIDPERLELVAIGPDGKVTLQHQNSAYDPRGFKKVWLGAIHEEELRLVKAAGRSLTESYVLQVLGLCPETTGDATGRTPVDRQELREHRRRRPGRAGSAEAVWAGR